MYAEASPAKIDPNRYYCNYSFRNPYKRSSRHSGLDQMSVAEDGTVGGGDSARCDANYVRLFLRNWEWRDILHEYTQNSSLHGLRYMGNTELHIAERYVTYVHRTSL
uniref:Uncharacterized protein n=1 Tax=Cacopsylla melanoneura TaxID=428564 RepID=A0A8D8XHE9_9HEMI